MKRTLGILLLFFAAVSAAVVVLRELSGPPAAAHQPLPPDCRLVVYYFHTDKRCVSCETIESAAKQAVQSGFAEEQKAGRIAYRDINWQTRGNEQYQSQYGLAFSTVVLSKLRDGREERFKKLDETWMMLSDREALARHIGAEMKAMLEAE